TQHGDRDHQAPREAVHAGRGSCNCEPKWQAWVWSPNEGRKIKRQFPSLAEAKSWRAGAKRELDRGAILPPRRDGRRLTDALDEFVEAMRSGEVRPKRRLG